MHRNTSGVVLTGDDQVPWAIVCATGTPRATRPSHNRITGRLSGSVSGQRSNGRGERVGRAGAEDEVGKADLLPSPLDLLGCRGRVSWEYGQSLYGAQCDRVGVGRGMNGATASPTTGTWSASSTSRRARKSRASWAISMPGSSGIATKVTVSATSAASASTLRSAHCHHHRCMQVGAVELS